MSEHVTLMVRDPSMRARLAADLAAAGFEPVEFQDAPPIASAPSVAVWVIGRDEQPSDALAAIQPWLVARAERRAVIVTWRPRVVRVALQAEADRAAVCAAPMRSWQIVDAVRAVVTG